VTRNTFDITLNRFASGAVSGDMHLIWRKNDNKRKKQHMAYKYIFIHHE